MSTSFASALYRGELMHARHDHVAKRAFRYGVYMASLDLDELPALDRQLRLFSHRKHNVFSFDDRDYAATLAPSTRTSDTLLDSLAALRAANGLPVPATTRLVTNLRVLGYTFNPVSFFLDYDARGTLTSAIAEVNNTYGGRFRYVLGPAHRLASDARGGELPARVGFRHVRELYVSPFLHGPATYDFYFDAPLDHDHVAIEMHVQRGLVVNGADNGTTGNGTTGNGTTGNGTERIFTARFTGTRTRLSDRTLLAAALRYPLMSAQVIGLIHFEALKLRLAGVPYRRPDRDHRPLPATR